MRLLAIALVLVSLGRPIHAQEASDRSDSTKDRLRAGFVLGGAAKPVAVIDPQRTSLASGWRPASGLSGLVPLGQHWSLLVDVTITVFEAKWKWDGEEPDGKDDNFARVRHNTLTPAFVGIRKIGPSYVYVGGGIALAHQAERNVYRPIVTRVNLKPVVGDTVVERSLDTTFGELAFRAGVLMSFGNTWVLRTGYAYQRRYADLPGAPRLDIGVGLRF